MRKPPSSLNLCLAGTFLCAALVACKPAQEQAPAPASDAPAAAAATAGPAAPAPVEAPAAGPTLDGYIIASTNEPFWSASVAGPALVLTGLDGQRSLAVSSSEAADGTRTVVATDASGKVELTVTAKECQDSMSGATFPFTAVLAIDGGAPLNGCARPASMPPPGEGL